jgi:hypothetical protein
MFTELLTNVANLIYAPQQVGFMKGQQYDGYPRKVTEDAHAELVGTNWKSTSIETPGMAL